MKPVRIIGARSGRVWPLVLRAAEESRAAGHRFILYVPEQYTLQAERDLITGLKLPGLLDIRVVSPRKLRMQVRERMGSGARRMLNEAGRAMAIHRVMTEKAEELTYYRSMTELPGAVRRVGEALDELRESEMTPEELEACAESAPTGAEKAKLKDLQLIRSGYETLMTEQFDDEKTVWTDTVNRLERGALWENADLAVYGFDSIRPDLRELLVRVCGQVGSASVYLTMDRETAPDGRIFFQQHRSVRQLSAALGEAGGGTETFWPGGEREDCPEPLRRLDRYLFSPEAAPGRGDAGDAITLYAGAGPWEEAEHIAETLRAWNGEGIPWNRMAVALPSGAKESSMLRAGLSINGIPFSFQQKEKASDHPVFRMLTASLRCLSEGYDTGGMITIARSGYSGLTGAEGLKLEDYARARGIEGKRWQAPFTAGENAAETEEIRRKLVVPLEDLREKLKTARNATASVEALADYLETLGVYEKLREQEEALLEREMYREAVVNRQVWQLLTELLEQLWMLLGNRRAAIRDLSHMIANAAETLSAAALPDRQNGVVIGEVGHLLAGEVDALVLPMAQDGMLTAPESGWLTDPERKRMEEATGRTIGISRENGCLIRKYDFYRTMTLPRRKLLVSWSLRGEDGGALQPDGMIERLRELFPGIREEGGLTEGGTRGAPVTPRAALDGIGPRLEKIRSGEETDLPEDWKAALIELLHSDRHGETVRGMLKGLLQEKEPERIRPETARRLFMTDQLSISRLEQFAACPYRHFIDYGLRPVQREEYVFADNDAGTFFHEALDRYLKRGCAEADWPDLSEERTDQLMDAILAEMTQEWQDGPLKGDAVGEWQGEEYLRRVRHAAGVLTRFAANSDFRTLATEQEFGSPEGLPPVLLTLKDGSRAAVRGKIDRIDTYENGEGVWLRIVDNKSREKKPDAAKMATGEQLQLMIYLKAAADSIPGARLAGALYFPVTDREVETGEDDPEKIDRDRMAAVRMKGLVTGREEIIRAMDRVSPFSLDKVFKADGSVQARAGWVVEEETMRGLTEAAVEKAAELCGRMRDGEIAAAPREDRNGSVCRYCEYHAVCRAGKDRALPRDPQTSFRDIAGKNTLREEEK